MNRLVPVLALVCLVAASVLAADTGAVRLEPAWTAEHGWQVLSVAFSPDGKLLASGSADRTARLWDPGTGKELRPLPKEC